MRQLLRRSPEFPKVVVGKLEVMLYRNPAPAAPKLERLALKIAGGVDNDGRELLIYYACSAAQQEITVALSRESLRHAECPFVGLSADIFPSVTSSRLARRS
jgi:hypothetical protein